MKKGRFGIVLSFYALLAFVFVIFKQPILCAVVCAVAIYVEKDEWAGIQTLQALFLSFSVFLVDKVLLILKRVFSFPIISGVFSTIFSIVGGLFFVAAIIVSILAILKLLKGQDVNIPLLSDYAYKAYGKIKPAEAYATPQQNPQPTAPPQAAPQAPVQPPQANQPAPTPPVQQVAPVEVPVQANTATTTPVNEPVPPVSNTVAGTEPIANTQAEAAAPTGTSTVENKENNES